MSHLVLELRAGEMMVVNGATIRFRSKCRVELMSQARFLFGKQIMPQQDAQTSMRKLYYYLQTAYVGAPEDGASAAQDVETVLTRLREELSPTGVVALAGVEDAFRRSNFYKALKLLRTMIQEENQGCLDAEIGP